MTAQTSPPQGTGAPDRLARIRVVAALALAGIAFAAYPVLRGSAPEDVGTAAAELYARPAWVLAHYLGMVGFVASAWGLGAVDRAASRLAGAGVVLVLPYYGAETFGLHGLGRHALETGDGSAVTATAELVRYQPVAVTAFAVGLLLVAAAGVRLLLRLRLPGTQRPGLLLTGLLLTGVALVTYLPQFFVPIEGRIVHGVGLGAGLLLLAAATWFRSGPLAGPPTRPHGGRAWSEVPGAGSAPARSPHAPSSRR